MAAVASPPLRHIFTAPDHASFLASPTCHDLLLLVSSLNSAVHGLPCSAPAAAAPCSALVPRLLALLARLEAWVGECPPLQQPMRYGNRAFRDWHARLVGGALAACQALLLPPQAGEGGVAAAAADTGAPPPPPPPGAALELATYLCEAFGNPTRIDYGTGHEVSLLFLLAAAARLRHLVAADLPALGLRVVPAYLRLCRLLQRTYGLEPAGSHGVWSLDDYHFLPFLLGASQLAGQPRARPRGALCADTRADLGGGAEYMYLGALEFITEVKRGAPFEEHSPMLAALAGQPTWARVNEELGRLYRSEVLGKLPVAQHFLFGALVRATWAPSREPCASECGAALAAGAGAGAGAAAAAAAGTAAAAGVGAGAAAAAAAVAAEAPAAAAAAAAAPAAAVAAAAPA
jgi:serine/threonine-protein phosphatase 2A activator